MDNENSGQSMMDIEYVPRFQKELGDVLKYAKGSQSMAEFAKKCGCNPVTFSRIVNGTIKKPLEQAEIQRIAETSELPTEEIFEDLMRANGMVPKDDNTPRRQESEKRRTEYRKRRDTIQSIIMRRLFEDGKTISPVFKTPLEAKDPTLQKSRFHFSKNVNFALSVLGCEPAYWNFRINSATAEELLKMYDDYENAVNDEIRFFSSQTYEVFLRDNWEPEAFANTRFSFVFVNSDLFEGFSKLLDGIRFNGSFSLILIDLDSQTVAEERFLPRFDGKEDVSLF